ncbi:MAG: tetratricopeptide repeat protein [Thermosynechococcaceae cyanobacterium]
MSSFLGNIRNRLGKKQTTPDPQTGSLVKVYGGNLDSPEALINRANKRAVSGDVDGAIEDFNEAIQLNPAKATAYFNRGFLNNTVGRFEQAILDFSEAIQLLPNYDEAYFQRAIGRTQLEDLQGAVDDLSQTLRLNPFCIKAYYQRAEVLAELGDHQGALADYSQAIVNVPKDANAYYRRGLFLSKLGEQPTAIEDFTKAIEHNPKLADAYFNRGYCYAQLGQESKATQDFSQALLHDPNHKAAKYNRAYALGILKEDPVGPSSEVIQSAQMAQVDASRAIPKALAGAPSAELPSSMADSLDVSWSETTQPQMGSPSLNPAPVPAPPPPVPDSVEQHLERAQNRAVTGDLDGAIADYTEIIDQDASQTKASYQRPENRSTSEETEVAIAELDRAIRWTRQRSLGALKDFSGELADTIATLKSGLPSSSSALSKAPLPPIEAAIEGYSKTIQQNPHDAQAYFERGQSRALLGDLEGAIADYTETIRLNPTCSDAYYKRGRSRALLGDSQGATDDLNHAIRQKSFAKTPTRSQSQEKQWQPTKQAVHRCDHAGNLPENQFCIHCGERLKPSTQKLGMQPSPTARSSEAEILLSRGIKLTKAGNRGEALQALTKALPLFLEQQQIERYQKVMKLIAHLSEDLA